mgnify:CR=1 FL=1
MPDRFVEHPNLLVTMTNVKFSELGLIESASKISNKKVREFNLILKLQVINLETLLKNIGELRLTTKGELHIQIHVL